MRRGREGEAAVSRIVLLGVMGAGKSTVGKALARRLGWDFLDFDREIERREGRPVAEIFRREGLPYFRRREVELTADVATLARVVLAPGGGWVTSQGVFEQLREGTFFVWLQASPEQVLARLARTRDERPLLTGRAPYSKVEQLLAEREGLYRRADLAVSTGGRTPQSIAAEIQERVGSRLLPGRRRRHREASWL